MVVCVFCGIKIIIILFLEFEKSGQFLVRCKFCIYMKLWHLIQSRLRLSICHTFNLPLGIVLINEEAEFTSSFAIIRSPSLAVWMDFHIRQFDGKIIREMNAIEEPKINLAKKICYHLSCDKQTTSSNTM